MKYLLIYIILIFTSFSCISQQYFNNIFEFGLAGRQDNSYNLLLTDSSYLVSGGTGGFENPDQFRFALAKFDFNGNTSLKKSWGDTNSIWYSCRYGSLIEMNNHYYTLNARYSINQREFKLVKYNRNLDTVSTINYKVAQPYDSNYLQRCLIGIENGFAITGTMQLYFPDLKADYEYLKSKNLNEFSNITELSDYYQHQCYLTTIDSLGNILINKVYTDSLYRTQGFSICRTSDNGFAIGVYRWNIGYHGTSVGDPVVIKTDSLGNEEWEIYLGSQYQDGPAMVSSSDDGNIMAASRFDTDSIYDDMYKSRIQLTKINNNGTIIWNKFIGESKVYRNISNLRNTNTNEYIICGSVGNMSNYGEPLKSGFLLKISADGDSLWYRQYNNLTGMSSLNYLSDALPTPDGGFIATGYCVAQPPDTSNVDGWILKVDSLGCVSPSECWVSQDELILDEEKVKINTFPNPATDILNIELPNINTNNNIYYLEIWDIYGRLIKNEKLNSYYTDQQLFYKTNVNSWKKGVYIINIKKNNISIGNCKTIIN